jgi:ATP-binding cassette subfamily B protein/subfamily B ATP-binding cassette protein MsbA
MNKWQVGMARYQWLLKYIFRQWKALLLIIILTVVVSGIAAISPLPMKLLVDYGLIEGGYPISQDVPHIIDQINTPTVLILAAALSSIVIFGMSSAVNFFLTMKWTSTGQQMVADLSSEMFDHLQRLSLLYHSKSDTGDTLSRLSHDTYSIYTITNTLLISPLKHFLTLIFVVLITWRISPHLTFLSLTVAPLLSVSAVYFGNRIKESSSQNRLAESRLLSFVHQTLNSIPIVQVFSTEGRNQIKFNTLASEAVTFSQRQSLITNLYQLINGAILTAGSAIVIFIGIRSVLIGTLTLGNFIVLIAYFKSIHAAFSGLFGIYSTLRSVEANIDRVLDVLALDEVVEEKPNAKTYPVRWEDDEGRVKFEGVTFGYENGTPILKGIDFEIEPGECVALVGKTGSGKSTVASLIPRFFDPWYGKVVVNDLDVRDVKIKSLRDQMAMVFQEPYLFPTTIAENIAIAKPGASQSMIEQAAILACADEFIRYLPRGYDTLIGESGYSLSGGEKQRISITRALLKDAPILILDEPTSAIDSQTEEEFLAALMELYSTRTTLVIAHRLSTIHHADRILVLENGEITESGTHDELLTANGLYTRLHDHQKSELSVESMK